MRTIALERLREDNRLRKDGLVKSNQYAVASPSRRPVPGSWAAWKPNVARGVKHACSWRTKAQAQAELHGPSMINPGAFASIIADAPVPPGDAIMRTLAPRSTARLKTA